MSRWWPETVTVLPSNLFSLAASFYLKWTLSTQTVTHMEDVTKTMVNKRYFPSKGTASDVGGIISANSRKNTVRDSNIDTHNVTFSPESDGK